MFGLYMLAAIGAALRMRNKRGVKKNKVVKKRCRRWWVRPWLLKRDVNVHNTLYGLRKELEVSEKRK